MEEIENVTRAVLLLSRWCYQTPKRTKFVEDVKEGDIVQTESGMQKVGRIVASDACEQLVCTINDTLRLTHKHPIKYNGEWVHDPKTRCIRETRKPYTGKLI